MKTNLGTYEPTYISVSSYLAVGSILSLCATSSSLKQWQQDKTLWTVIFARDFPWRSDACPTIELYKELTLRKTILRQPQADLCYRVVGEELTVERTLLQRCEGWVPLPDGSLFLVESHKGESRLIRCEPASWESTVIARISPCRLRSRLVFALGKVFIIGGLPNLKDIHVVSIALETVRSIGDLQSNFGAVFACRNSVGEIFATSNCNQGTLTVEKIDADKELVTGRFDISVPENLSLGIFPCGRGFALIGFSQIRVVDTCGKVVEVKPARIKTRGFPLYAATKAGTYILSDDEVFLFDHCAESIAKVRVFETSAYVLSISKIEEVLEESDELLGRWY